MICPPHRDPLPPGERGIIGSNRMKDLLNLLRWQDGLDILILTYIFYRLYLWLRKKKALRMILVILALPIFYIFARDVPPCRVEHAWLQDSCRAAPEQPQARVRAPIL